MRKNNPIYEFFCKGIMNKKHKGARFDDEGNFVVEPKAEFGDDVSIDGKLTLNSASDIVTKDGSSIGGDVSKKQNTLYRHTVTITNGTAKAYATFTADSEKNTKIDSIQDLIAVFGNTKISISGFAYSIEASKILLRLDIGTAIGSTNVQFAEIAAGEFVPLSFTSVFGTSGFVIDDDPTAM